MTTILDFARDNLVAFASLASLPALAVAILNWFRLRRVRRLVRRYQERLIQRADLAAGLDALRDVMAADPFEDGWEEIFLKHRDDLNALQATLANELRLTGRGDEHFQLIEARRYFKRGWYGWAAVHYQRVLKKDLKSTSLQQFDKRILYQEWQMCCIADFDFNDAVRVAERAIQDGFNCCIPPSEVKRWRYYRAVGVRLQRVGRKLGKVIPGGRKPPEPPSLIQP